MCDMCVCIFGNECPVANICALILAKAVIHATEPRSARVCVSVRYIILAVSTAKRTIAMYTSPTTDRISLIPYVTPMKAHPKIR